MEGSASEAVFESLDLNPQLFINETLNTVNDLVDEAFHYYHQSASTLLNADAAPSSQYLAQGIDVIRSKIQSHLDVRLGVWEKYCLHYCFRVPENFTLPKTGSPDEDLMCQDVLLNRDLDAQLISLRERLTMVGRESAELKCELQDLERQSASSDRCAALAYEALKPYEQNSFQDMFLEMMQTASDLRTKMDKLTSRRVENTNRNRAKRILEPNGDLLAANGGQGLSGARLEDLHEFVTDLKKT